MFLQKQNIIFDFYIIALVLNLYYKFRSTPLEL